jgi:hypothetical protein
MAVSLVIAVSNHGRVPTQQNALNNATDVSPEAVLTGVPQTAHSTFTNPSARIKTRTPAPQARVSHVHESAAFTETRAASHPAPSAPLTQEEKLLLRIAHRGDPEELAMLNPQVQAQRDAESEAECLKFVDESTKGDSE